MQPLLKNGAHSLPTNADQVDAMVRGALEQARQYFRDPMNWLLGEHITHSMSFTRLRVLIQWAQNNLNDNADIYARLNELIEGQETAVFSDNRSLGFMRLMVPYRKNAEADRVGQRYELKAMAAGAGLKEIAREAIRLQREKMAGLQTRFDTQRNEVLMACRITYDREQAAIFLKHEPALADHLVDGELRITGDNWEDLLDLVPVQAERERIFRAYCEARTQMVDLALEIIRCQQELAAIYNQAYSKDFSWSGWQAFFAGWSLDAVETLISGTLAGLRPAAAKEIAGWKAKLGLDKVMMSDTFHIIQKLMSGEEEEAEQVHMDKVLASVLTLLRDWLGFTVELTDFNHYARDLKLLTLKRDGVVTDVVLDLEERTTKTPNGRCDPIQVGGRRVAVISMNISHSLQMTRDNIRVLLHELGHVLQLALAPFGEFEEIVTEYLSFDAEMGSSIMETLLHIPQIQTMFGLRELDFRKALIGEANIWCRQTEMSRFYMGIFGFKPGEEITFEKLEALRAQIFAGSPMDNPTVPFPPSLYSNPQMSDTTYQGMYVQYIQGVVTSHAVAALLRDVPLKEAMKLLIALYRAGSLHSGNYADHLQEAFNRSGVQTNAPADLIIDMRTFGRVLAEVA